MSEYLKIVVTSVVLISGLSVFFPEDSFGKYANLLSGIIVMSILLTPVLNKDGDFFQGLPEVKELEISKTRYLMDEFEKELSIKIENMLYDSTGKQFSATVYAETDGEVVEIQWVELAPFSEYYASVVAEYLGIEEEKIAEQ